MPGAFGASPGGASLFIRSDEYFEDWRKFFVERGCRVKKGEFPLDATIEERASVLRDQVERFAKERGPVWLVAHSQGGLDARYALKSLGLLGVSALVTIGAPHSGTPLADWVVSTRERRGFWYWSFRAFQYDLDQLRFAPELRAEFLAKWKEKFEAVPGVRYASARARCQSGCYWPLRFLAWWQGLGSGDGIVPAASQSFGEDLGEFDLDHLSAVAVDSAKAHERRRLFERTWVWLTALRR